jgi:glycerate kinase
LNGTIVHTKLHDPLQRQIHSSFGFISETSTAIIELADASGLRLLQPEEYDPVHASTFGTGEMMLHTLDAGAKKIILGIGGSATIDGATGILKALGTRFFAGHGNELHQLPSDLVKLASVDISAIDKRIFDVEIVILCDVENLLLGENGAANIFGPQKGATRENIKEIEAGLTRWRNVTFRQTEKDMSMIKYGGAAGGVAAGLATFLNARLVNGIDYFLQLTNFEKHLQKADIVITGEGSIDEQTLEGKGPFGVAQKAK